MSSEEALEASLAATAQQMKRVATVADIARTKRSMSTHKGIVNMKLQDVENLRKILTSAVAAKDQNKAAIQAFCDKLLAGLDALMAASQKYQLSVERYIMAGKNTEEADDEFYQNTPATKIQVVESVLNEQTLASNAICRGMPSNDSSQTNAQSSKTVKVEKELKPDQRLEESDSLDTYRSWIAQLRLILI